MNLSKSLALILIILAIGCKSDKPVPEPISSKILGHFNELAKASFKENYDSYNFYSLKPHEKKQLRDDIEENIDYANNWELLVIDSFYIRNYESKFPLDTHYSFISNKSGKFYFIYLPYFYNFWLQDSLYNDNNPNDNVNSIELKDSVNYSIISLNSPMMDEFLDKEVFITGHHITNQIEQGDHLIYSIFPYLFSKYETKWELSEELNNYPEKNFNYIMNILNPILNKEHTILGKNHDYRIYSNFFGFIIYNYSLDECTPNKVKLTFYFIPKRQRPHLITM